MTNVWRLPYRRFVNEVLRASGERLDPTVRTLMDGYFGHDFGHVRVHADTKAAESAMAIRAWAYSVGGDIVFADGQFKPRTAAGRGLLAHELTHVLQQGRAAMLHPARLSGGPARGVVGLDGWGTSGEAEANRVAEGIGEGRAPALLGQTMDV